MGMERNLGCLLLALLSSGCHLIAGYDAFTRREDADTAYALSFGTEGHDAVEALTSVGSMVTVAASYQGPLELAAAQGATVALEAAQERNGVIGRFDPSGLLLGQLPVSSPIYTRPLAMSGPLLVGSFKQSVTIGEMKVQAPTGSSDGEAMFLATLAWDDAQRGSVTSLRAFGGAGFVSSGHAHVAYDEVSGDAILAGRFLGELALPGCPLTSSATLGSMYLARIAAATGECTWGFASSNALFQEATAIATDLSGFVVTGTFSERLDLPGLDSSVLSLGGADFFVARYDSEGSLAYHREFGDRGGNGLQSAMQIDVQTFGQVVLAGYFDGELDLGDEVLRSSSGHDLLLLKLDRFGNRLWSRHFSVQRGKPCDLDNCEQDKVAVRFDQQGNIVLAGYFGGSIDFGGTTRTAAGVNDLFVVKYDRYGELLWSGQFGDDGAQCGSEVSGGSETGSGIPRCHVHLAVDDANDILVGGHYRAGMSFQDFDLGTGDGEDAFLAKLKP